MKQFTSHILIVVLFCSTLCCCNYTDLVAEEESTVKSETKLVEIVGGENARIDQFPHHAALIYQGEFTCSGSIIAKKFIVTAAHCVESGIEGLYVNVGTTNRGVTANQRLNVEKIKVHENYRDHPKYVENDIALIMLKTNLKYNTFVKPIELETQEVPIGSNVTIVGYGSQFTFGPVSEFLMFDNEIRVKSNHGCEGYKADNMSSIICLDSKPYGSTCNGDSGGSAIRNNKIVGLTSFRSSTLCGGGPTSFTKISYFAEWIMKTKNNMKTGLKAALRTVYFSIIDKLNEVEVD